MYTHFCTILTLLLLFATTSPSPPTYINTASTPSPGRTCYALLFSNFEEEKKKMIQEVSL
jgi:hypothetical protein